MKDYWTITMRERAKIHRSGLDRTRTQSLLADILDVLGECRPVRSPEVIARRVLRAILPYTWTEDFLGGRTRCIAEEDWEALTQLLGDEKKGLVMPFPHEGQQGE